MSSVFYYTKESIKNFKELRHLQLVGQEDKILTEEEKEEQGKLNLYKDCAIFVGEIGVIGYPILEEDTVRSATLIELIDLGEQQLLEGEILNREAGTIDKVPQPSWQYKWDFELLKWLPDETKLHDGQYVEGEEIKEIFKPEDMLNPMWNKELHQWKEQATENEINLHTAKEQYKEYIILDTPLNFEKMEEQGILVEYKTMMSELESIIETLTIDLYSQKIRISEVILPKPSKNLIDFKNKFNKLFY